MYIHYKYLFGFLFIFAAIPQVLHADTFPEISQYSTHITWNKEGSPYILDHTIFLTEEQKLTMGPGTVVRSATTSPEEDPFTIFSQGQVEMLGTSIAPVQLQGLGTLFLRKENRISNAIFEGTGIAINSGTTTLTATKITGANPGIDITHSVLDVRDSEIIGNAGGIRSNLWSAAPVLMMKSSLDMGIGGEGEAPQDDPEQNHISIHNSIIENNEGYSVINSNFNQIDARDNWWGSSAGPQGSIIGAIKADPWKTSDPRIVKKECCSNVLFLPGFQASRLDRSEPGFLGTSTNRLWEPNRNEDVRKLFLNPDGTAKDTSISVSGVIDSALGLKNIYAGFIAMMNGVVAEKKINEWLPFAYDWRMPAEKIVNEEMITVVERLAASSQTGKVMVVAHSNGGLVAKALGLELEKRGKAALIEKVVFVASPLLGTPQGVAGMLHGDRQEILGGLILKSGVARTLGLNMLGAYGLLPAQDYFSRSADPVLTFAGKAVGSFGEYISFLTSGRPQPAESDLKSPALLSAALLSEASGFHSRIDSWKFPTTTKVVSLIGWGLPTAKTVDYSSTSTRITRSPDGDGTVVSSSAAGGGGDLVFFNQDLFVKNGNKPVAHADILEAEPVQKLISSAVVASSSLSAALPEYLTRQKPDVKNYPSMKWITVSVHSPVDMHVYDGKGGHMGPVQLPGSDFERFENTIGGQYDIIGDEKYYTLPGESVYTVVLRGTGTGRFTFQVEKFMGDMARVSTLIYPELPVSPVLVGTTTVGMSALPALLRLDADRDGITDISSSPITLSNQLNHTDAIKAMIVAFKLHPSVESSLISRTESVRTYFRQQRVELAADGLRILIDKVKGTHWTLKELPETPRRILQAMYESALDLAVKRD